MNNDLISRNALLDAMEQQYDAMHRLYADIYMLGRVNGFNAAIKVVKEHPAVDAAQKWISVEEHLPDEINEIDGGKDGTCSDLVIVFVRDDCGNSFICDDILSNGEWVNYPAPLFEVTHWMPMPEPPKED